MLFILVSQVTAEESNIKFRWPSDHWANELTEEAKQKYNEQYRAFPCENIPEYAAEVDVRAIYWSIRDAGIFKDESCEKYISDPELPDSTAINYAVPFYMYRLGDESQLNILIQMFDDLGESPGDSLLIELFGFLPDWEYTGRRLARSTHNSDGAGATSLSIAFQWKQFLYGHDPEFKNTCERIFVEERVTQVWYEEMCGANE